MTRIPALPDRDAMARIRKKPSFGDGFANGSSRPIVALCIAPVNGRKPLFFGDVHETVRSMRPTAKGWGAKDWAAGVITYTANGAQKVAVAIDFILSIWPVPKIVLLVDRT
jgi:hypothetical protein